MGHRAGGRGHLDAATVGAHYRHTTPAMLGLVVETVEAYLHTAMASVPQAPITGRQTGRRVLRRGAELRQWKVWL
jgi:hypothetical protein